MGLILALALLGQWVSSRLPDWAREVVPVGMDGASLPEPSVGGKAEAPAGGGGTAAVPAAGSQAAAGVGGSGSASGAAGVNAEGGSGGAGGVDGAAGEGGVAGPGGAAGPGGVAPEPIGESPPAGAALPGAGPVSNEIATGRERLDRSAGVRPAVVVTAYYVDLLSPDTVLQPVEVLVPQTVTPLRTLVELLLAPPEELQLTTGIPPGTRLVNEGLNLQEDGTLVVDLTAELYTGSGSAWANAVTYSLVYTLTEHPGVNGVLLRVQGQPAELEGRLWDRPLTRQELAERGLFRVQPVIRFQGP